MFDQDNYPEAERDATVRRACYRRSTFPAAGEPEGGYEEDSPPTLPRLVVAADRTGAWVGQNNGVESSPGDYRQRISDKCDALKEMLLTKNAAYGNSAFESINIFSKLPPVEGIFIRIDDKLKRLRNGSRYPGDNDRWDLIGYLLLLDLALEDENG